MNKFLFFIFFFCFIFVESGFSNGDSLSLVFMASSDVLNLLFAVGVWFTAYIAVAILSSLRVFASLCSSWITSTNCFKKATMGYAQLVIGPAGSGKVIYYFLTPYLCCLLALKPWCFLRILPGFLACVYVPVLGLFMQLNFFFFCFNSVNILLQFVPTLWSCRAFNTCCEPRSCCGTVWLSCGCGWVKLTCKCLTCCTCGALSLLCLQISGNSSVWMMLWRNLGWVLMVLWCTAWSILLLCPMFEFPFFCCSLNYFIPLCFTLLLLHVFTGNYYFLMLKCSRYCVMCSQHIVWEYKHGF